jgi:hypothetical protein
VTGGATVNVGGLKVSGGSTIYNAGLTVTGGATVNVGGLKVSGGSTIYDAGLTVTGGSTIYDLGLTVTGGATVNFGGLKVSGGSTIYNAGLTVTGGATVNLGGLTVTGGATVNSGGMKITGGLTVYGDITFTGNSVSDLRLKRDITPLKNSLSKISKIRGVYYRWIDDGENPQSSGRRIGVIAQDVQNVFPEATGPVRDGKYLGVIYTDLIPVMIEAIRELNERSLGTEILAESIASKFDRSEVKSQPEEIVNEFSAQLTLMRDSIRFLESEIRRLDKKTCDCGKQ